jgi:MFS family permease
MSKAAFSALRLPGYGMYLSTFVLTMMADNVEHVVSYWVMFRKFDSPMLGGFAVVSHWLPYILFSVWVGGLNDRFDSRRLIQAGALLFIVASAGWAFFFLTDTLTIPGAMALLACHGCAGVLWMTSSQMLLYDIVGPVNLQSAVRLAATGRYIGTLVGPGVGSLMLRFVGARYGMLLNTAFYLPLIIWLMRAPYGRHFRGEAARPRRAVRGLRDIVDTIREVRPLPVLAGMIMLAGCASFFIGNSYQPQMPGFAIDLGHGDPGVSYMVLLGADAAGALVAGIVLEARGGLFRIQPRTAMILAASWAVSLGLFAQMRVYWPAVALLFVAGFFELSFSSMVQTIVQMKAPDASRGRVLGLYNMAGSGLRTFSGITVGFVGGLIGIHTSMVVAAIALCLAIAIIGIRSTKPR